MKPLWTRQEDELLAKSYRTDGATSLAEQLNRTRSAISSRARRLGLARTNRWSESEDEYLHEIAETLPVDWLLKHWQTKAKREGWPRRQKHSIVRRLLDLGYSARPDATYISALPLATVLGVRHYTICRWISRGQLKSTQSCERGNHRIHYRDFAAFLLANGNVINCFSEEGRAWAMATLADWTNLKKRHCQ